MPLDSAERQTHYSDIVIKKHKNSEIVALAYRLDEMNGMQQYLPCLKMTPNSPAGMPRGDTPKLELEMCMRLTGALLLYLSTAYFASKGADHFPIDYQKLRSDLILIEKNEDR